MKTIFDITVRRELEGRIRKLTLNSKREWGKMDVCQMLKHCALWDEWVQGTHNPIYRQEVFGKLFGRMALRKFFKDDRPFTKNVPAGKLLVVTGEWGDVVDLKNRLAETLNAYADYSNPGFIHDFFGKMTVGQIGILAYKHYDHHLRQFGV